MGLFTTPSTLGEQLLYETVKKPFPGATLYGFKTSLVFVSNPQSAIRLADELGQHLTLGQLAWGNEADKHNSIMPD